MYLLYVDESGNPDGVEDKHFVLGGIALFERSTFFVNKKVDDLADQLYPGTPIEFHAQAINQHSAEPWRSVPSETRLKTLNGLCDIIAGEPMRYCLLLFLKEKCFKSR